MEVDRFLYFRLLRPLIEFNNSFYTKSSGTKEIKHKQVNKQLKS